MKFPFVRLAAALLSVSGLFAAPAKPNIIYILADDIGQGELGCYGQKLIQTPNLDRMAKEGTRFTQAYSGTSVCAPSRTSLMLGLDMGHCPIRANRELPGQEGQMPIPAGTPTVASVLKSAGYQTACVGKWGMGRFDSPGSPLKVGFDKFYGYNCQRKAHEYFPTYLYDNDRRIELDGKTYSAQLIHQQALDWIRSQKDKPFFLFYATTLPHSKIEIDSLGEYENKPWTKDQKTYAAMVTRLDQNVGDVLTLLKELNIDNNTLVIFSGDNGTAFIPESGINKHFNLSMDGKLRGIKRSMYEGGLRQPAIARWPATIPAERVSDEPWAFWDFMPTAAELAGTKSPKTNGLSLVSFLKGSPAPKREAFYWELHEGKPIQAVRFDNWKAVKNGPDTEIEIYDLAKDSGEKENLASTHPELVTKANKLMKSMREDDPKFPLQMGNKKEKKEKQKG